MSMHITIGLAGLLTFFLGFSFNPPGAGQTLAPSPPRLFGSLLGLPNSTPEKLPWPHQMPGLSPGEIETLQKSIWIYDNFGSYHRQNVLRYFHDGLDIMLDYGTRIYAVDSGYVTAVSPLTFITKDTPGSAPGFAWGYYHTGNFRFQPGDYIRQGDHIGDVVDKAHVHLSRIVCSTEGDYCLQPDSYLAGWKDTYPPEIFPRFFYFVNNSDTPFSLGSPTAVRGDVDIVIAARDESEYASNGPYHYPWCVTRIEYEIAGGNIAPFRQTSFDFATMMIPRDPSLRDEARLFAVFKSDELAIFQKTIPGMTPTWTPYQFYTITNTDGTGAGGPLDPAIRNFCWDTDALDSAGRRIFPDGLYTITVKVTDSAGNSAWASEIVDVENSKKSKIRR